MRYELPPGLSAEEERAIVSALDEYFGAGVVRPDPWALAGRAEALGLGALQVRHQSMRPWGRTGPIAFTRRGTEPRSGRGDAK
ncbi:MAG TPA: hypothetical protein VGL18_10480 [Actinomycetota bacterium]|jgi:hypothetical protein